MRYEERVQVRKRAAARQKTARILVTYQLSKPPHRYSFNFCRRRRRAPRCDVCVERGCNEIGERAYGSRRRRDVAEEARVSIVSARVNDGAAILNQAFKRLAFRWKLGLQLLFYPRGARV